MNYKDKLILLVGIALAIACYSAAVYYSIQATQRMLN